MSNKTPFFSIVIPTRNRHDTLEACLNTCLEQGDFTDFEVIVSDNASTTETKSVVERFQVEYENIRYVRSEKPLAMSLNFEQGVNTAQGKWVIVIGDDDGLLPGRLAMLKAYIESHPNEQAISWQKGRYYWPNHPSDKMKNFCSLPVGGQNIYFDAETIFERVVNYELSYAVLPMLYHAAVHQDVINTMRKESGSVFKSTSPDVYSGFAVAHLVKRFVYLAEPVSFFGLSGKSTGTSYNYNKTEVIQEYETLNDQSCLEWHPDVPKVMSLPAGVLESYYHAKDRFFPDTTSPVDEKALLVLMLVYSPDQDRSKNTEIILNFLKRKPELYTWYNQVIVPNLETIFNEIPRDPMPGYSGEAVCQIDVQKYYGVNRVDEMARMHDKIVTDFTSYQESLKSKSA